MGVKLPYLSGLVCLSFALVFPEGDRVLLFHVNILLTCRHFTISFVSGSSQIGLLHSLVVLYIFLFSTPHHFSKHIYLCLDSCLYPHIAAPVSVLHSIVFPVPIRVPGTQKIFAEWIDGFIIHIFVKNKRGEKYNSNRLSHKKGIIGSYNWKFRG